MGHGVRRFVVCLLWTGAAIPCAVAADEPAPKPWRDDVPVDLGAPAFEVPLPFDVPFWISSEVDATVETVWARYREKVPPILSDCALADTVAREIPAVCHDEDSENRDSCIAWERYARCLELCCDGCKPRDRSPACRKVRCDHRWCSTSRWTRNAFTGEKARFRVQVDPLKAQRDYEFEFFIRRKLTKEERKEVAERAGLRISFQRDGPLGIDELLEFVRQAIPESWSVDSTIRGDPATESLERDLGSDDVPVHLNRAAVDKFLERIRVKGSTYADFATEHRWYVSADAGIAWAPELDDIYPYGGTNIYFKPVNKKARFDYLKAAYGFWGSLARRVSITIGVTGTGVNEPGQREGLIGESGVLLGGGLRLSRSMRLSAGALIFRGVDPNPLVGTTEIEASPFVSFSFDWDVADTFGPIGKKLKIGQ